ncbi:MAG: HD domain-containing protein, partial [bacterium]
DIESKFVIYPAATRMHHAYIGGLLYHTVSMLELCDKYIEVYPTLKRDYLICGVIVHDMMKVEEYEAPVNASYSLEGQLLGHIVMGVIKLDKKAEELKILNTEEVLILKHMLISHHGQQAFGSPVKPATKEALLLWYLDTIDSKLRVLEEELEKTDEGTFTNNINVLDRAKFYKTKN